MSINVVSQGSISSLHQQDTLDNYRMHELAHRSKMNGRAPIFRLPVETISSIFKFIQEDNDDHAKTLEERKGWHWLTVTHVCKLWRDIAIKYEALWTRIDTKKHATTEQTRTYLERSGNSKLLVQHGRGTNERGIAIESLKITMAHISRIRELHIWGLKEIPAEVRSALRTPAPALQEIVFHIQHKETFDVRDLFGGYAPKLKNALLYFTSPSWVGNPILRNLRELSVGSNTSPIGLQDTYTLLKENVNVEALCVSSQPTTPHPDDLRPLSSPIRLMALKDLGFIDANYEMVSLLLKSVILPRGLRWHILCRNYPINKNPKVDPRAIIPNTLSCDKQLEFCEFLDLTITPNRVYFKSVHSDYQKRLPEKNKCRRSLSYSWDNHFVWAEELQDATAAVEKGLNIICSVIKDSIWTSTRILQVDFDVRSFGDLDDFVDYQIWEELLESLPELQELSMRHENSLVSRGIKSPSETFCNLLKALRPYQDEGNGKVYCDCRNLTKLHLWRLNLKTETDSLLHSLGIRSFHGFRLRRLELYKPLNFSSDTLDTLMGSGIADEIVVLGLDDLGEIDDSELNTEYGSNGDNLD